jgi:hypothetical protein
VQAPEHVVIALRLVGGIIITTQIDCGSDQVSDRPRNRVAH